MAPHPSWKRREPEWAALAPGVRWKLSPIDGVIQGDVNERVAKLIGGLQQDRADLEDLGYEDEDLGVLADLDTLAGLAVYASGVYFAERILLEWEGIDDAETGEPVPVSPEAIRAALRYGPPEGGPSLLGPFMAWLARPQQPIVADLRALRILSKWAHGPLAREQCQGCELVKAECHKGGTDGGDRCPRMEFAPRTAPGIAAWSAAQHSGLWRRAGMGGQLVGLDYAGALAIGREAGLADEGAFIRCLGAIEGGAIEAAQERAEQQQTT